MPTLIIDKRSIEVPEGTKVIEAAERLGIMIPRFCFHPALGAVGACRMCAVKVIEGSCKGIQMSCMLAAEDHMVVSTTDPEALDFRRNVIEWLMLNHPHDCPVCDEGGHCLLQDTTVAGGHGLRRYRGPKRTHVDQDLGPLIAHEMNRCIQCYRCVRYYREYAGGTDLGVMGIGSRVYFGRVADGRLESPFSGNLIDICPTGVFTDKPSRYKGRRWDFERTASVCTRCALGCAITVSTRYRDVVRHEARLNPEINGYFICDKGRYGYTDAASKDRLRQAELNGTPTALPQVMAAAVKRLAKIQTAHGPGAVAWAGSPQSSLQSLAVLHFVTRTGGFGPVLWPNPRVAQAVCAASTRLDKHCAVSLSQVAKADAVLVVGTDAVDEAPMLALALRQAFRKGARVVVIDSGDIQLPFEFDPVAVSPDALAPALGALIRKTMDPQAASVFGLNMPDISPGAASMSDKKIAEIAAMLQASACPVIVCGTETVSAQVVHRAADLATGLSASGKRAGLFFPMPGANAFAAGRLTAESDNIQDLVEAIDQGRVKALVVAEQDLFSHGGDTNRIEQALQTLEFLVVLDYRDTPTARMAHAVLPIQTLYEAGGIFVNNEARAQQALPALSVGTPISIIGKGDHPPRQFQQTAPGSQCKAAWQLLLELSQHPVPIQDVMTALAKDHPVFGALTGPVPEPGRRLELGEGSKEPIMGKDLNDTGKP
jgi:NADH-quinone oxidoreductase subunit G